MFNNRIAITISRKCVLIGAIAIEGRLFAQIDYYVRFRVARTANIRIAVIASAVIT